MEMILLDLSDARQEEEIWNKSSQEDTQSLL